MSQFWPSFWLQAYRSLQVLLMVPSLSLMLLGAALVLGLSLVRQRPFTSPDWRNYYWLALTQLFFFPAVVSVSVFGQVHRAQSRPNTTANWALEILFWLALGSGAFWIHRMKGLRWFAFGLIALQHVLLLGAFFVAATSIIGVTL